MGYPSPIQNPIHKSQKLNSNHMLKDLRSWPHYDKFFVDISLDKLVYGYDVDLTKPSYFLCYYVNFYV
jgi:hypothetical protein